MFESEREEEYIERRQIFENQCRSVGLVVPQWSYHWQIQNGEAQEVCTLKKSSRVIGYINGKYVEE